MKISIEIQDEIPIEVQDEIVKLNLILITDSLIQKLDLVITKSQV